MTVPIDTTATLFELKARQDIHDALMRYCRGVDRCDRALTLSAYHPDAFDDHGSFRGSPRAFADWAIKLHLEHFVWTTHTVTNEYVEIDGQQASAETYFQVIMRLRRDGRLYDQIGGGRYLDRFECRQGHWKIARRLVLLDWNRIDPVTEIDRADLVDELTRGTRDTTDSAYAYFRAQSTQDA
jgi:hypothetical protein